MKKKRYCIHGEEIRPGSVPCKEWRDKDLLATEHGYLVQLYNRALTELEMMGDKLYSAEEEIKRLKARGKR